MITEVLLLGIGTYVYKKLNISEEEKFRNKFNNVMKKTGIKNKVDETYRLLKVNSKDYGYDTVIKVPDGLSFEHFTEIEPVLRSNFGAEKILFKEERNLINMTVIIKPLKDLEYAPINTKVNEIYVGYTHNEHIIINLDSFNNILIAGCQGTGKSRLLLIILSNIITMDNNVDLYFAQVRKSDLRVFEDCKQVKYFSKNLKDTLEVLKYLDEKVCIEREKLIDKYTKQGIYNITDYNKRFINKQLSRIIIALDEFSFFMPNSTDSPDNKKIKNKCLDHIINIVRAGRSSGITTITSLQKPTKNSIPSDIKTLIATRISFKQMDAPSSIAVLNNGNAVNLDVREAIVQTNREEHIKVPFIDHQILMKNIKLSIENNHKFINLQQSLATFKKTVNSENPNRINKQDGIIKRGVRSVNR